MIKSPHHRAVERFGQQKSVEATIHNLNDAPPPSDDNFSSPLSPSRDTPPPAPPPPALSPKHLNRKTATHSPLVVETKSLEPMDEAKDLVGTSTTITPDSTRSNDDEEYHDEEEEDDYSSDEDELQQAVAAQDSPTSPRYYYDRMIYWYKSHKINMDQVSTFVAKNAPCFWCCAQRLDTSVTDRSILFRLNLLCAFFALAQVGSAMFLLVVLFAANLADRSEVNSFGEQNHNSIAPNLWNVNGTIILVGGMGLIIFVTMLVTLRSIQDVNLLGSIRYMWALLWILPIEIFMVISLFDYHRVTQVWIKHFWYVGTMAWFRDRFCFPGTSRSLCTVPVCGLPDYGKATALPDGSGNETCREGELNWCLATHNATNCTSIRNEAQEEMETTAYLYYTLNAVWGLLLVVLLLLTVHRLQSIITKPIVQRSREANVPGWLTLPIVGCAITGSILLFSQTSVFSAEERLRNFWIGIAYLVCAALFLVAAVLGWFISVFNILNSRDLRTKHAATLLFIATMVLTTLVTAAIFAASIAYSVNLVDFPLTDRQRGNIACFIDSVESCSFCNNTADVLRECPEWTNDDVVRVLRTQLKGSAVLAAIFLIYAFGALRFGFVLRHHVAQYQIDYV